MTVIQIESVVPRRWWQTRRVAAELHARRCTAALIELHEFIDEQFEEELHPWASYYTNPESSRLAQVLQDRAHPQDEEF